ncbi:MAG: ParA family protein [Phycisphaerales bacterium]|nr:ParA family protein [Phycisphaerales bacterium]
MPPVPARLIALINQKGGVGKTTTTVNLAAAISREGRRVLVIDLDPQAHATLHLGASGDEPAPGAGAAPGATVYDLLLDPAMDPREAVRRVRDNLFVIAAETDLAAAESELVSQPDRIGRLRGAIAKLQEGPEPFEFVLIDCPPSLGVLTLNALAAAREVFIPMQAHFLALQGVSKLLETVGAVARSVNPKLFVTGVILCMHDGSTTHSKEVVADLDSFFEAARRQDVPWRAARVYRPAIRRNIKLAECPSFGQTIFDYAPTCPGATDYAELARAVINEWDTLQARRGQGALASSPTVSGAAGAPSQPEISVVTPVSAPSPGAAPTGSSR